MKVMAYVMSHDDLRQHLASTVVHPEDGLGSDGADSSNGTGGGGDGVEEREGTGGGGGGGSSRETPEDLVEVLCGDRVVEPHLYIGEMR